MRNLNDKNFQEFIKTGASILVFYKDHCPLCPLVVDVFQNLKEAYDQQINFFKIDVKNNQEIGKFYDIIGVPTIITIKNGKTLNSWPGLRELETYQNIPKDLLDD